MTMKALDRYTYRIMWLDEDAEFVGLCAEFPSLSWLAPKQEDALKGIRKVVRGAVKDLEASGEKLPEPLSAKTYSGQLRVRIPPALHRQLAVEAAEQNRSLNRVIINKLAHG
jgi:predicted HicB family RNase H-like nuclease